MQLLRYYQSLSCGERKSLSLNYSKCYSIDNYTTHANQVGIGSSHNNSSANGRRVSVTGRLI